MNDPTKKIHPGSWVRIHPSRATGDVLFVEGDVVTVKLKDGTIVATDMDHITEMWDEDYKE